MNKIVIALAFGLFTKIGVAQYDPKALEILDAQELLQQLIPR
jgi:hypothetical protein